MYHLLVLEARGLCADIDPNNLYNNPLSRPAVFISSIQSELPIIIDTGASVSITPIPTDFVSQLTAPDLQELKQVNGSTQVVGQGTVRWTIEDVNGSVRAITTKAYYVPDAKIRLFSPQVYINENDSSSLHLDKNGLKLTLDCNSILHFPINRENNLPFMLTEYTIKQRKQRRPSPLSINFFSTSFCLPLTSEMPGTLTDFSILRRDNINLTVAQQELALWHQRWAHCDLARVQMILSKPRQVKCSAERGEISVQMVCPRVKEASSCPLICCPAC